MLQSLATAILGTILVLAPFAGLPTASIQPLQVANASGVENTICTTFSINEESKSWGTAAHCVLQQDDEGVLHNRPVRIGGHSTKVMLVNPKLDIAVLQAEVSAPAIPVGKRPALGDTVRVYGYMWGAFSPTLFKGDIANVNIEAEGQHFMLFDMRVGGGHSGSPILDSTGAVISVMQVSSGGFSGGALYGYLDEMLPYWSN